MSFDEWKITNDVLLKHRKEKNYVKFGGDSTAIHGPVQFNLLCQLGLLPHHKVLDIGCSGLFLGKYLMLYLNKGNYYAVEPEKWQIEEAVKRDLGESFIKRHNPHFLHNSDFNLQAFNQKFDFIMAHSIFTHAAPHQITHCIQEVAKVMKENGFFVGTFLLGQTNYKGNKWVYPGAVLYTTETLSNISTFFKLDLYILKREHEEKHTWFIMKHPKEKFFSDQELVFVKVEGKKPIFRYPDR